MGVSTTALVWACVKIEEAIPAQESLNQGTVNEVQVPIGGVVKAIYVTGNGYAVASDYSA